MGYGPEGGVTVSIEGSHPGGEDGKPPPEKRARLDTNGDSKTEGHPTEVPLTARVEITSGTGPGVAKATLHFAAPLPSLITVSCEGSSCETLLEGLWPEDDGRNANLTANLSAGATMTSPGRPYGWAQILAGLREQVAAVAPGLLTVDGVTASDVVLRVRSRLE